MLSERHQRPAARCTEDIVVYDYQKGAKTPLREYMLKQFRETWEAQEQAKQQGGKAIRDLFRRVEQLEKESWDKDGAVEDLGGGQ